MTAQYKIIPTPADGDGHLFVGRFTVPVDDNWHEVKLSGEILHVDTRSSYEVEFWALTHSDEARRVSRFFRVFGTGHRLPVDSRVSYIGTALDGDSRIDGVRGLVWHLFEHHRGPLQPGALRF